MPIIEVEGQKLQFPEDATNEEIDAAVNREFAPIPITQAEEDLDIFSDKVAQIESGGDPNAVSHTGATGLFQFTKGVGKQYGLVGKGFDDRTDPIKSKEAFLELLSDNMKTLKKKGIESPTLKDGYLAHQQGASGYSILLKAAQKDKTIGELPEARKKAVLVQRVQGIKDSSKVMDFLQHFYDKFD